MPLAFTQENFLVLHHFTSSSLLSGMYYFQVWCRIPCLFTEQSDNARDNKAFSLIAKTRYLVVRV